MVAGAAGAAAERPHPAGPDPGWSESWSFEFAEPAGLTGVVRLTTLPASQRSSYEASVVVPDFATPPGWGLAYSGPAGRPRMHAEFAE